MDYTEEDVKLVAMTLAEAGISGATPHLDARTVLEALAAAGLLLTANDRRDLAALAHASRRLNQPMLHRLKRCAEDASPNWEGAVTIYPGEAQGILALVDCADVFAAGPGVPVEPEPQRVEICHDCAMGYSCPKHDPRPAGLSQKGDD